MPAFMARAGENLNEYCKMCTHDLPKSKVLFQHLKTVSMRESFLRDVKEPFAKKVLEVINYIKNLSITDKLKIGNMLKERAVSFCINNKDKYRWLITKCIALWFINATEDQTQHVHKTLTSSNISIDYHGMRFFFHEIYAILTAEQSYCFHLNSCCK